MMTKRRITDRLGRVYEVDDETGVTTPVLEETPAQTPTQAPAAQPASRFPQGVPLFGETLMPRETTQRVSGGQGEETPGISNLERLGAVLTALGNPSAALALLGQAEKRAKERATVASRTAAGGGLARAQELEAAGDPQGALAALAQALRGAQEPALVTQILKSSEALQKRTRGSKAAKALTSELVEKDPVFRDGALATVLAFKYVEAFPDAAPQVGQIIKGLRDEVKWEKVGTQYVGTVPTNPRIKPFVVPIEDLHNVAGTLMATRGTQLTSTMIPPKDITLEPGKTPTRIPGETILAPGQQAPGVAPAGAIVPTQGFVPPGQVPAAVPRTLATPPPHPGVKPTSEQAAILASLGVPPNLSWDQIRQQYPQKVQEFLKAQEESRTKGLWTREDAEALLRERGWNPKMPGYQAAYASVARQFMVPPGGRLEGMGSLDIPAPPGAPTPAAPGQRPLAERGVAGAELERYRHKRTLASPPPGTTQAQLEQDYAVISEAQVLTRASMEQFLNRAEGLLQRRDDLFPQPTGNAAADIVQRQKAKALAAVLRQAGDPDIQTLDSLGGMLMQIQRAFGGTSRQMDSALELLRTQRAFEVQPGSYQATQRQLKILREQLDAAFKGSNLPPMKPRATKPERGTAGPGTPLPGGRRSEDRAFGPERTP